MTTVEEIRSIEELLPYRDQWEALLRLTPDADFFQTLDWLEVYWRHYGADQKLRVLLVRDGDELIGVMPLTVCAVTTRLGQVLAVVYPLHDWGSTYGPIGPRREETIAAGLNHIRTTRRDWQMLELGWMSHDDSSSPDSWNAMLQENRFPAYRRIHVESPVVDLSTGWETYWANRKSHWRTNCRRNERRLNELGEVTYLRYRPSGCGQRESDPRWDLYEACEQLAAGTWQSRTTDGTTLSSDSIRPYLRDLHQRAASCGGLDLNLLRLDGKLIAFAYNYVYRGRVSGLRLGYDAEYPGAGTVLMIHALRDSAQRGDQVYDLLPDSFAAKRYWYTSLAKRYRYTHYPFSVGRVGALRVKRWWEQRLHSKEDAQGEQEQAIALSQTTKKSSKLTPAR